MFKALIFDFDGVLTDTEPVHMESWLSVLESSGISFDSGEYDSNYLGLNDSDFLDAVGKIHGKYFDVDDKNALISEKTVTSIGLLEREIPVLPGVEEFIAEVSRKHKLAVCSGANRGEIDFILRKLNWMDIFKPVTASDSVSKGKPDPEGYIRTIEGLIEISNEIILPEEILAIEDSPKGIAAAKAAGLKCVAIANSYNKEELAKADWIIPSIEELYAIIG